MNVVLIIKFLSTVVQGKRMLCEYHTGYKYIYRFEKNDAYIMHYKCAASFCKLYACYLKNIHGIWAKIMYHMHYMYQNCITLISNVINFAYESCIISSTKNRDQRISKIPQKV